MLAYCPWLRPSCAQDMTRSQIVGSMSWVARVAPVRLVEHKESLWFCVVWFGEERCVCVVLDRSSSVNMYQSCQRIVPCSLDHHEAYLARVIPAQIG